MKKSKLHISPAMKPTNLLVMILICLSTLLQGCASIIASTSEPGHIDEPKNTRTFGTYVEDQNIEVKVKANLLNADQRFGKANVGITSYNRIVLMVGQVPSQDMLDSASKIAGKVREVRKVHNEMTLAEPLTLGNRANDSWIATKIRAHMIATKDFPASRTVTVVENGVVYLMGLLSETEANWAVDIVRQVYGVKKIVKIIEYTS
ncbi:MAG: BON domain-containing protein [Pseudomonadales bacterium]|nr:BON domain-containing protein [Pseudomonadales bacterium]